MEIGIKYCGGCNSRYDRGKQVNKLKDKYKNHTYVASGQTKKADIWLIVCGCPRACPSFEDLIFTKKYFILKSEKEFEQVYDYLDQPQENDNYENPLFPPLVMGRKKLKVGDKAFLSKIIGLEEVNAFAELTGDYSRLHVDPTFAKKQWFGQPIAHGVLVGSLISTVMGMKLPGSGTIFMKEEVEFKKPVFFGDEIHVEVTFVENEEHKKFYVGTFLGICRNQRGEIVIEAKCKQMMMKTLFFVEVDETV